MFSGEVPAWSMIELLSLCWAFCAMFGANMLALEANATKVRGYDICCQFYCNTSFTVLFIHYISASVFIYTYVYTYTH